MDLPRRRFLAGVAAGWLALSAGSAALRAEDPPGTAASRAASGSALYSQTHTFKTFGDLELKADVYRADDDLRRPVLMCIHGGALIRGARNDINPQMKSRFLKAGYAVVTIDYRLAPETQLPAIIEDLHDAHAWLHAKGPELLGIDPGRIVVGGDSAGGYLTLMAGFCVNPRPVALLALWGYGDITADWYARPSEFYRAKYPLVSAEEARNGVGGRPLVSRAFSDKGGRQFYLYCRQQGLWPRQVSGFDPATQNASFTPFCPVRNVTKEYPPTVMVHGTDDTDVPYSQAVQMDRELARVGVEHRLITVPQAGHDLEGGDPQQIADAYDAALRFVERQVKTD